MLEPVCIELTTSSLAAVLGENNTVAVVSAHSPNRKPRYNIEAMASFLPVQEFFSHVYLVDLSPSLCEVARQRFERLGWKNITVVCQDARSFCLPDDNVDPIKSARFGADVVTLSYSLSMIPGTRLYKVISAVTDGARLLQCCGLAGPIG